MERKKNKDLLILGVLKNSDTRLTDSKIAQELEEIGHDMSERTVEALSPTDGPRRTGQRRWQTRAPDNGKRVKPGDSAKIIERVGFFSAKIDRMTYQMNFDMNTTSGTVVINVTIVDPKQFLKHIPFINKVYAEGYAMGHLMTFLAPGKPWDISLFPKE